MHMTEPSDDRKIEMADKKQKREENVCGTKEGLHRVYTGLSRSVYTGHGKETVENHLKFVSICHK